VIASKEEDQTIKIHIYEESPTVPLEVWTLPDNTKKAYLLCAPGALIFAVFEPQFVSIADIFPPVEE
jgi:hypothetical protein